MGHPFLALINMKNDVNEKILYYAKKIEPILISLRREFHAHPELSFKEYRISKRIAEELFKIVGIEVRENLADGTGVMGILEGEKPGKCILLRADIDALPIEEKTDLEYKSQNEGCMHACGHDAHITWLLGTAMILSELRSELPGTVKFVFQPAEEIGKGARLMIEEDHVMENPDVDMAFAAHAWPTVEAGKIGIAQRYPFGCAGGFRLTIHGKGGHGSMPHQAVNPIMIASQICMMLPQIAALRVDAIDPAVVSVGAISSGELKAGNIIPDTCMMSGTIRSTQAAILDTVNIEIERIIKMCCEPYGVTYEYTSHWGKEGVRNHPELVDLCEHAAKEILGEENAYVIHRDNLGGEDFACFSRLVPSVYMYAGIKSESAEEIYGLHSPKFKIDECVLSNVAAVFAKLVFDANEMCDGEK